MIRKKSKKTFFLSCQFFLSNQCVVATLMHLHQVPNNVLLFPLGWKCRQTTFVFVLTPNKCSYVLFPYTIFVHTANIYKSKYIPPMISKYNFIALHFLTKPCQDVLGISWKTTNYQQKCFKMFKNWQKGDSEESIQLLGYASCSWISTMRNLTQKFIVEITMKKI